ncbi:MAG: PEP-CTERM sorting domain-containing protein [Akkermansia muciniphila]|nr:PEP-CTERM sorting domain-containing protein [Akkermansia muciniphila]
MKQSKVTETIRVGALTVCAAAVAFGSVSHADAKPNLADEAGRAEAAQVVEQSMKQQVLDKLQKSYGRSFEGLEMELLKQRSLDPQNLLRFLLTAEELDHCLLLVMLDAETGAVLDMRLENQLATTDDMVRNKYATVLRNATTGQTLALQSGDFIPQVGQGGSRSGGAVDGSRLVPFAPYFPWVAEPRHPLTDAEATSDDTSSADDNTPRYTVTSAPASTPSPAPSAPAPVVLPSAPAASVPSAPAVSGGISAGGSFGGASAGGGSYGGGSTAPSATSPFAPAQPTPQPPAADPTEPEDPTDPSDEENESTDTTTPDSDSTETLPAEDTPLTTAAEPTVRAFSARSLKMLGNTAGLSVRETIPSSDTGSGNEAASPTAGYVTVNGTAPNSVSEASSDATWSASLTKTGTTGPRIETSGNLLTVILSNSLTLTEYETVNIDFSKVANLAEKQYIEVKFVATANDGADLSNVKFKGFDGYKEVDGYYINKTAVTTTTGEAEVKSFYSVFFQAPEPTTAVLSLLGLTALVSRRRRPNKA